MVYLIVIQSCHQL